MYTGWGVDIVSVRYNSNSIYYNGKLYLNVTVDKSPNTIECKLMKDGNIVYSEILEEGSVITCVEVPYSMKYKLIMSTENLIGEIVQEEYDISSVLKE